MSSKNTKIVFDRLLAQEFLDMVNDAFFFFDRDLRFVFVNKKGEKLVNKTRKQMLGKKVSEVFPEVENMVAHKTYKKTPHTKNKTTFDYYSPSLQKWLSVTVHTISLGYGVCVEDITDTKKAEGEAVEKQEILNAFFENSPVSLAIYDEEMNILNIDKYSAGVRWGKKISAVRGKSLKELAPKDAQTIMPFFKKALQQNKTIYTEHSVQDKQGGTRYISSSRFPLNFTNGKRGVGAITIDVTERVLNEKQKDDFIAMASHELKTPLTSAKIFIQVLSKRFQEIKDLPSQSMLKKVEDKINQLDLLIKELLDATITNRGKVIVKREKFIFRDLASQIVKELQMSTKHRLIFDWQTSEYLYADKEKVSQILTNFITNAIKYSPDNSDIIISSQKDGNFIVVSVKDFGIGIPQEDQAYIFDRFYQADSHKTYPGLGLGLYIAKEIIVQIGGQIWVESKEGKGSTFYFSLPIYKSKVKNKHAK